MQREPDGTCSLHTTASTLDDDGNYTVMAANPQVDQVLAIESVCSWAQMFVYIHNLS